MGSRGFPALLALDGRRWASPQARAAGLVLLSLGALSSEASAQGPAPADATRLSIETMHHHPWFTTVAVSSFIGWILGAVKGFSSSRDWLQRYVAAPHWAVVMVLDLVIFVVAGAYIGTGIYTPTTFVSALGAGLTWPIGLGALTTTDRNPPAGQPRG